MTMSGRSSRRYLTTPTTGGARWKLVECTSFNKEVETINEISTIRSATSGLLAIINDILDFSKIESGKFVVNPVDSLINVDHSVPNHLIGDDTRIEQILMNLLGDPVKFTKEGSIELSVEVEAVGESGYGLIFKVRDSGIGIKKEGIGTLLGSLSQVDTTKNRASPTRGSTLPSAGASPR